MMLAAGALKARPAWLLLIRNHISRQFVPPSWADGTRLGAERYLPCLLDANATATAPK